MSRNIKIITTLLIVITILLMFPMRVSGTSGVTVTKDGYLSIDWDGNYTIDEELIGKLIDGKKIQLLKQKYLRNNRLYCMQKGQALNKNGSYNKYQVYKKYVFNGTSMERYIFDTSKNKWEAYNRTEEYCNANSLTYYPEYENYICSDSKTLNFAKGLTHILSNGLKNGTSINKKETYYSDTQLALWAYLYSFLGDNELLTGEEFFDIKTTKTPTVNEEKRCINIFRRRR